MGKELVSLFLLVLIDRGYFGLLPRQEEKLEGFCGKLIDLERGEERKKKYNLPEKLFFPPCLSESKGEGGEGVKGFFFLVAEKGGMKYSSIGGIGV